MMFDPTATLADGVTLGGIGTDNLKDGEVTAAKCAPDVATQAELDAHTALTAAVHGAVATATASKILIRDAAGRGKVVAPAAEDDIALKSNVTTAEGALTAHAALTAAVHGAVSANTASKVVIRDASARAQFADPSAAQDAATKNYVDTHTALTTAHGAVSTATASKMVVRDASGRAAFADPAADQDAATKKYVTDTFMGLAGGTFTGKAYAQANTDYTTGQVRNIFLSTGDPAGGGNGDVWLKYSV
jgi:hypothetical protein